MKIISIAIIAVLILSSVTKRTYAFDTVKLLPDFVEQHIRESIFGVINILEQGYIYPERSKLIAEKLKHKLASNGFDQIDDLDKFVTYLSVFMREVSGDGYLNVVKTQPYIDGGQALTSNANQLNLQYVENFGFEHIEILSGNIGYLKLKHFYQHPNAELQAARAFNYLSGTDAIIIDLRDVEGNSISLAQYLMSYFVEHKTILSNVMYDRQKKTKTLTAIELASNALGAKTSGNRHFKDNYPIYILTSAFVSGTGEFFSYTLKHLDKAVIVGEQTMGVALISKQQKVNEFISISMPIAIPIHPKTNTNWERHGVIPDFTVEAEHSFDLAYKLAKEYLQVL
ncbi:S41 family peptidase [Thalassotalea piscium]|uniref:Tail specific protease domain-containing protein n=1 Tax=Thalassotalea piscium TaxID=1230533 RepID=A0A7X0NHW1_9GAMM|nr:S41 family peptidase [Thalassotalea piscium]MBB6543777.1 hypothetical protein [Thalassotalea piscium]